MYSHVVMFTLPDPDDVPTTASMLAAMGDRIPQIRYLEVGVEELPSDRSAHIVLITRFDSVEAMEVYQAHPHHQIVIEHLREVGARATKVDFSESQTHASAV